MSTPVPRHAALHLWLSPTGWRLQLVGGWRQRRVLADWQQPLAPSGGELLVDQITALRQALGAAPAPLAGRRAHLRLHGALLTTGVLRGALAWRSQAALQQAAGRWFARQLAVDADSLRVAAVLQPDGQHLLAAAADARLLDALAAALTEAGLRLRSLRPTLADALARAEAAGRGPLLAACDGTHLQLAWRQGGAWTAVGSDDLDQPGDWPRQAGAFARRQQPDADPQRPRVASGWLAQAAGVDGPVPAGWRALAADAPADTGRGHAASARRLDFLSPAASPRPAWPGLALLATGAIALAAALQTAPAPAAPPPPAPIARAATPALAEPARRALAQAASDLGAAWLPALSPLGQVEAGGVRLLAIEPDPAQGLLKLSAWAPNGTAMASWVQRLDAQPGLAGTRLTGWDSQPGGEGQPEGLRFELLARVPAGHLPGDRAP